MNIFNLLKGTGGAISIKTDESILITPSGVLKESVSPEDIFSLHEDGEIIQSPSKNLKYSSCFPNFRHIYNFRYVLLFEIPTLVIYLYHVRDDAVAVYHTHSPLSVLASLMTDPGARFTASSLQMVKAMRGLKWSDTLELPIIENRDTEDAIAEDLEVAVRENPGVDAVLIRGHGLYVWGPSWQAAKVISKI